MLILALIRADVCGRILDSRTEQDIAVSLLIAVLWTWRTAELVLEGCISDSRTTGMYCFQFPYWRQNPSKVPCVFLKSPSIMKNKCKACLEIER